MTMAQDQGTTMSVSRTTPLRGLTNRPLYSQAAEMLGLYLAEQAYEPGTMLPAEDELARQLQVSRSTLREAMGLLEREGRVVRKHGVGTFVTNPAAARFAVGLHQLVPLKDLVGEAGPKLELLQREISTVTAPPELQTLFGLDDGDKMLRAKIVMGLDGQCLSYGDYDAPVTVINPDDFARSNLSILEYCLAYGRPNLSYAQSELHAVNAGKELAECLRLPAGTAVLHMIETLYSEVDEPMMRAYTYHVTERLCFRIIRHVPSVPGLHRAAANSPGEGEAGSG
jgi:GntR family transcriptional regulator